MSGLAWDRMGGPYPGGLHGCEELADGSVLAVEDCTDAILDSQEAEGCLVRGGMSEGKLEALGQALKRGKRLSRKLGLSQMGSTLDLLVLHSLIP